MNNKKKLPIIVYIAVFTMITTFVWVVFEVYRTFTRVPEIDVPVEVLLQLNPNLNAGATTAILDRVFLDDNEIGDTQLIDPSGNIVVFAPSELDSDSIDEDEEGFGAPEEEFER